MSEQSVNSPRAFRAAQLRNCIAALDLLTTKTQQMLADLEPYVEDRPEPSSPQGTSILQMYVSRIDQSVETRCKNLRATLRAIERERLVAQRELEIA